MLGMVLHPSNSITLEAEGGGLLKVQSQPALHGYKTRATRGGLVSQSDDRKLIKSSILSTIRSGQNSLWDSPSLCHVADGKTEAQKRGSSWWAPDSPAKTSGSTRDLRVLKQDVAFAGVRLGHPDVRVPAPSSASPCLLKEGPELASESSSGQI